MIKKIICISMIVIFLLAGLGLNTVGNKINIEKEKNNRGRFLTSNMQEGPLSGELEVTKIGFREYEMTITVYNPTQEKVDIYGLVAVLYINLSEEVIEQIYNLPGFSKQLPTLPLYDSFLPEEEKQLNTVRFDGKSNIPYLIRKEYNIPKIFPEGEYDVEVLLAYSLDDFSQYYETHLEPETINLEKPKTKSINLELLDFISDFPILSKIIKL